MTERRAWSIARFPEPGALAYAVLIWLGLFLLSVLFVAGRAIFGTVTGSFWEHLTQVLRWFAFGTGIWLTGVYLRLHVAHGRTRRDFLRRASVYLVAFAAVLAALTTVGYLLELALYRVAGWPHRLTRDYLFTSGGEVGPILLTYVLVYLAWAVAGALAAATFRRLYWYGLVITAPLAVAVVAATEIGVGARFANVTGSGSVGLALASGIGGFAVALAATWALAREMPLREEAG
ncbi:MAG TPA: hypothetical protein VGX25_26620 [Actinophytocola sp.]|uniref:hypothetical protein n=1 Tax=Actinophytocola sp. TaxID=1872138 RepID=UPI002DDD40AE|nr:hypothetical protein [Actinophytocola sp.]HEV2782976.1 hypothetical protein [Actinophytocola sp.]